MQKIIAACGNDCAACPRHLPKTNDALLETARLWYKIGYRSTVVTASEISCGGCTCENWCRYEIVRCVKAHNAANCSLCGLYPCAKILTCFEKTMVFEPQCKKVCTAQQYEQMKIAFFEKRKNLENGALGL